jgi:probable F420-dependent oxidoreductase
MSAGRGSERIAGMSETYPLSGIGIWSAMLRYGDPSEVAELATEMEGLGYSALWIPDIGGDVWTPLRNLLGATRSATIATGILNVWMHTPEETATQHHALTSQYGPRFLCGIGVSHRPLIDRVNEPGTYQRPVAKVAWFLDGLDGAEPPLSKGGRCIAALGPKMLDLAATRTSGTHPYLVTPEHTATARAAVGPDALVASEQGVVLDNNPETARATARTHLETYRGLPNYTNNWKRVGFTDDDLADGGSDRLVDALVAWGDEDVIVARVQAHRDAGASHVCIQALESDPRAMPAGQWRRLASALL